MQQCVEVMHWGDFDIQKTHSVWVGNGTIPVYSGGMSADDYIESLKANGFTKLETIVIEIDEYC